MSQADTRQRQWLLKLGRLLSVGLAQGVGSRGLTIYPSSRLIRGESNADGWYVEVGRVRGDRGGALQVWLDRWPRTQERKIWFGYKGTRREQIVSAAKVGTPEFGPAIRLHDGAVGYDKEEDVWLMKEPLRAFGRPVAELYETDWAFYGIYLRRTPRFSRVPSEALTQT